MSGWTDIVSVATGEGHTVALKANGRVIARGNNKYGQCDVQEWTDIVQIAVSGNHTIGLKNDGTVLAVGWNSHGPVSYTHLDVYKRQVYARKRAMITHLTRRLCRPADVR